MGCWLISTKDCSRPCNCLIEHPLVLNSNPGIAENDYVIIIDGETRIPCCMAMVNRIRVLQINGEMKVHIYLRHCDVLNEATMNRVMRIMRSINPVITIINVNQDLCK